MEITVPQISLWVWIIGALVLMPTLAYVFAKSDLEAKRGQAPDPWNLAAKFEVKEVFFSSFIGALFWPLFLGLGLVALVLVGPTLAVISKVRKDHEKREKEAATEREVLARLEEERKAEEARINRELGIVEPEPEPVPEPPRESLNAKFWSGKRLVIDGGKLEIELDWGQKASAASAAEAEKVREQAALVAHQSEQRRRMRAFGMSMKDIEKYERTVGSERRRLFE